MAVRRPLRRAGCTPWRARPVLAPRVRHPSRGGGAAKGVVPLALVLLAGCGRSADFSGPAPAGALRCAVEHGLAAGYEVTEGTVEGRSVRLAQRLGPPPAEARAPRAQPELGDVVLRNEEERPVENQLAVAESGGRLTVNVIGLTDEGVRVGPGSNALDQAQSIIALCTTSPPVFPDGSSGQTEPQPGRGPI